MRIVFKMKLIAVIFALFYSYNLVAETIHFCSFDQQNFLSQANTELTNIVGLLKGEVNAFGKKHLCNYQKPNCLSYIPNYNVLTSNSNMKYFMMTWTCGSPPRMITTNFTCDINQRKCSVNPQAFSWPITISI